MQGGLSRSLAANDVVAYRREIWLQELAEYERKGSEGLLPPMILSAHLLSRVLQAKVDGLSQKSEAGAVWPPVCVAIVTLRFVARRMQRTPLRIDDWLVLPALVGVALKAVGYPTPKAASVELAMTTSSRQQTVTRQVFWATELMQVLALTFVKLSCMFFYRRVFRAGGTKIFDAAMFTVVAIIIAWAVSFFFAFLFMCGTHFDYLWTSLANEAKCARTMMLQNGFAISDVITDLFVLLFPIPLVVAALLSTAAIYTMIIEAGFGLCAANLPTLYGMMRNKGLQNLMNSFQSLFSLHSVPREENSHIPSSENKFRRFPSDDRGSDAEVILHKSSIEPKRSEPFYNSQETIPHGGIRVTRDIDIAGDMA
ncbi:MAG: hypothetical protein Q9217_000514 [Psora testacea]